MDFNYGLVHLILVRICYKYAMRFGFGFQAVVYGSLNYRMGAVVPQNGTIFDLKKFAKLKL
jgi:hypothetical protein